CGQPRGGVRSARLGDVARAEAEATCIGRAGDGGDKRVRAEPGIRKCSQFTLVDAERQWAVAEVGAVAHGAAERDEAAHVLLRHLEVASLAAPTVDVERAHP